MSSSSSSFLALILLLLLLLAIGKGQGRVDVRRIPADFSIGTSTSAHQVEGAWTADGKGQSIWDNFTHTRADRIRDGSNVDKGCDHYHKYKEDIELLGEHGFDHYRFSLSWSRLLPTGRPDNVNRAAVRFYHGVLDELERRNVTPYVTIYHWDHPQVLEDELGGWLNESMARAFSEYARFVYEEFGPRVRTFTTINEPYVNCYFGYGTGAYAPGRRQPGLGEYQCVHNQLKGHALAYRIYDRDFRARQGGRVGIVNVCFQYYARYPQQQELAERAFEFECGWTSQPIFGPEGDYPEVMKRTIAEKSRREGRNSSRLPEFSPEWIEIIKGSSDYFGLNHYSAMLVEELPPGLRVDAVDVQMMTQDADLLKSYDPKWPGTESSWLKIVPEGIRDVLNSIRKKYGNPPVYIMECGASDGNGLDDHLRVKYLHSYMQQVLLAKKRDKCDVKAFTIWSFLDSFEWSSGYTEHFGLVQVDFSDEDRKRTPKNSLAWLKTVLQSRQLLQPISLLPKFDELKL
ncbi:hypothetical protein TKK_0010713 [Trichogramma kaykai]|uniref:Cytosolic beta-glucosidase n=1 Tax=Trichogramma kaykai TaxID=54128 RepID=A0ABD2WW08_9HYME